MNDGSDDFSDSRYSDNDWTSQDAKTVIDEFKKIHEIEEDIVPISEGVSDVSEVTIELEALRKMLFHVYEFGNFEDAIKKWKEVYGLMIGRIEYGRLIITDAAPITHGTARGVEFKKDDYVFAAKLNDMITADTERKEFFVGWYHSHPAIGLFLSGVDLVNHLGYQLVNEVAAAIVFDHCLLLEKQIPFKVFRLDSVDFSSQDDLGYHEVSYIIPGISEEEQFLLAREMHDEIAKDLKKTRSNSAEKLFRKQVESEYREFMKRVRKEHIEYEKTDYKKLRKGKKVSKANRTAPRKKGGKKKPKAKKAKKSKKTKKAKEKKKSKKSKKKS
ncbi:MAG: hypothetical protein ACTSSI_13640 [Candidatus Helarchaeota archaeon]